MHNGITVNYYNTNGLLINTPVGIEFGGVSAWQGIRSLGSDIYLIVGTTNPTPNTGKGLIYIGDINCQNGLINYLTVPQSLGTSIYGPDYSQNTGLYTFVGSYLDYNQNIKGFVYRGNLDSSQLLNPDNILYPSVNQYFDTNFLHSNSNGLIVGNSGNTNKSNSTISYIYDINNLDKILTEIKFPNSETTTTYGIWYNGNNSYTIVGGYSLKSVPINKIYLSSGIIQPLGNAFIVDYNSMTNQFENWTGISYSNGFETHFQGISGNNNQTYSINADVVDLKGGLLPQGYFLTIGRDNTGKFTYNTDNWIKISYDSEGITSSNSVADNKVVGLYISGTNVTYQAEIINQIEISKSNDRYSSVRKNELVRFSNNFTESQLINYSNCTFTFLENGTYFINFNIYVENTNLPSVNLNVEYTVNGVKKEFLVAQKGIDDIGTGTAHSLVIPCSFINNFNINDTFRIRNVSSGEIVLISNYVPDAINAIISISKLA